MILNDESAGGYSGPEVGLEEAMGRPASLQRTSKPVARPRTKRSSGAEIISSSRKRQERNRVKASLISGVQPPDPAPVPHRLQTESDRRERVGSPESDEHCARRFPAPMPRER